MKTPMTFTLDVDRARYLQEVAARLGVPNSRLVDHLLAIAAKHVTAAELRAWAGPGSRDVPAAVPLRGSEQRVYAVLTGDWQELADVHGATGQSGRIALRALEGLVRRGLVERKDHPTWIREDNGLPQRSYWRRATAGA